MSARKSLPGFDLRDRYLGLLDEHIERPDHDPQANPVKQLAFDIASELMAGKVTPADLDGLVNVLSDQALVDRAERLDAYIGPETEDEHADLRSVSLDQFEELVRASALEGDKLLPFETFCEIWERPSYGFVFTAHPTFSLNQDLRTAQAGLMQSRDGTDRETFIQSLHQISHRPDEAITLNSEHGQTLSVIAHLADALDAMAERLLRIAQALYPLQWAALRPSIATVASWVGYDLDGRTDISWWTSLTFKLAEKAQQLRIYAELAEEYAANSTGDTATGLMALAGKCRKASIKTAADADAFSRDLNETEAFLAAANGLTASDENAILSADDLIAPLEQMVIAEPDLDARRGLLVLLARIRNFGLGTANIHVRINAVQLHNALREHLAWQELGDGSLQGRLPLSRLTTEIENLEPVRINFATLLSEQTTAKRQMMLLERILRHIDEKTPIRYLIAECEQPLTALGALYFAKLFGVSEKIDISPLFETPEALERGGRLIEQLIENPEYRRYIEARGRLSIQTGFSDAGRFIGQLSASLAIERLQIQLAKHMDAAGLKDIEALVFNTHGESLGRGSHPGGMRARQHHIMTPWSRNWFARLGIR